MKMFERTGLADRNVFFEARPPFLRRATPASLHLFEFAFYLLLFYSYIGPTLGITVPYLGTSLMLGLTTINVLKTRSGLWKIYRPIFRPIMCIVSVLLIQYFVHGETLSSLISFVAWAAILILVQSFYLSDGVLHRLSFVIFAIGVAFLPYLDLRGKEGAERAGLSAKSLLANPNALGSWFGFCAIYFLVRALIASGILNRIASGIFVLVSLIIVGLTVSRSALVSVALAGVVVFRSQLRRGFIPVLIAVTLASGAFAFGLFDTAVGHFVDRGTEESSRTGVLPYAFQRIVDSPLVGVGMTNLGTKFPFHAPTDPHNSFFFFALSSGVVPLLLFLAYWMSAIKGAWRATTQHPYFPYLAPLLVYCSANLPFNDTVFMSPWFIAAFSACLILSNGKRGGRSSAWNYQ